MLKNYEIKLEEIKEDIKSIGKGLLEANKIILDAITECNKDKLDDVKSFIRNTSSKINTIDNSIISTLALHSPEAKDLREMISYFKITNELLKATSNTRSLAKGFVEICDTLEHKMILEYIKPMLSSTISALENTIEMIDISCADEIREAYDIVLVSDNKAEDLYEIIETDIITMAKNIDKFDTYHSILRTLRKIRKISEKASSIANLLLYANNGGEFHNN